MENGIDISQYQGNIGWATLARQKLNFIVLRSTICLSGYANNEYKDWRFDDYYNEATAYGLRDELEAYHVVTPFVSAETQIRWIVKALQNKVITKLWLDVERKDNCTPNQIADNVWGLLDVLEDCYDVGIYTGAWFWNPNVARSDQWQHYNLWTASYTNTPILPYDWAEWDTWQYTNDGQVPGIPQNVVDLNYRKPRQDKQYITLRAGSEIRTGLGVDAESSFLAQNKTIELKNAWVKDGNVWIKHKS